MATWKLYTSIVLLAFFLLRSGCHRVQAEASAESAIAEVAKLRADNSDLLNKQRDALGSIDSVMSEIGGGVDAERESGQLRKDAAEAIANSLVWASNSVRPQAIVGFLVRDERGRFRSHLARVGADSLGFDVERSIEIAGTDWIPVETLEVLERSKLIDKPVPIDGN